MDNKRNRIIFLLMFFTIVFTIAGSTLAYWNWETSEEQKTAVTFTVEQDFSCAADGGGNITSTDAFIAPTSCTNTEHAIQREVTVMPTILRNGLSINMSLYLDIDSLTSGLTNSQNFRYALTTSSTSCESGIISSGTFNGLTTGNQVQILNTNYSSSTPQTYYLYIWLDKAETSPSTMDQSFSLSISGNCTDNVTQDSPAPEAPVLDEGMIPVTIANNGTVTTIASNDSNWYDYDNKEWANVVLVDSDSRSTYKNTTGKTVNQDDILAYYTWIPRYSYKIPTKTCSEISTPTPENHPECYVPYIMTDTDKEGIISTIVELFGTTSTTATAAINTGLQTGMFNITVEDTTTYFSLPGYISWLNHMGMDFNYAPGTLVGNATTNGVKTIDISFESAEASVLTGDAVSTYRTHPAFVFGGETKAGIWVGKFEPTGDAETPTILPNTSSLTAQNVSTQFQTSLKFAGGTLSGSAVSFTGNNTYGLTSNTDSHMMKNSEWGAVAYLSHSLYGINDEIRINNKNNYTTGCGASTANGSSTSSCEIAYGGATSYPQSTTGNITGIFDMSGGAYEYVMGNYNNTIQSDGFTTLPTSKYYDKYTSTDILTACNGGICYGHALSETMTWYSDFARMVNAMYSWFRRGNDAYGVVLAGAFAVAHSSGGDGAGNNSWRSVLVVG